MGYEMKRRYLSATILLVLLLGVGLYMPVRSNGDLARAAPSHSLSDGSLLPSESQEVGLPSVPETSTRVNSPTPARTGNLLRNVSFERDGQIPVPWRGNKYLTLKDRRVCYTARHGSCSFGMEGDPSAPKSLAQVVKISGRAGDSFILSGWSRAWNPEGKGGPHCLQAQVFHTDGTKRNYWACFPKRTHGWLYRERRFTVAKDYNKIVVRLWYARQSGRAWFDLVRLVLARPMSLNEVKYWAYQIQDISDPGAVGALVASHYDMLVLEPTRTDWSSANKFFKTKRMVTRLKNSRASKWQDRKLVMAYIDIGEAEDWRWYWDRSLPPWDCKGDPPPGWPDYIVACDPDGWEGNYPVAYWDDEWQDIVIYGKNTGSHPHRNYNSVIDEVIKDGFDGIYLDWVEGFENKDVKARARAEGLNPAREMIWFIEDMRNYARKRNPDFLIIQQNAAALIDTPSKPNVVPALHKVIDAIAQEEIWYGGIATDDWDHPKGHDLPTGRKLTQEYIKHLAKYQAKGLPVFNCEYALKYQAAAYKKSYKRKYVPYVTRRSLSRLTTMPPPGY